MPHDPLPPHRHRESRRQFLRKTGAAAAGIAGAGLAAGPMSSWAAQQLSSCPIVLGPEDPIANQPPVKWAAAQLRDALTGRGIAAEILSSPDVVTPSTCPIHVRGNRSGAAESFTITPGNEGRHTSLELAGPDSRGLVYALLELTDRVRLADDPAAALNSIKAVSEQPANEIRSVARAFVSDVEDKFWFQDRAFWKRYLTMLAAQRFNRFSLTLGIGYDFTTQITDCYFHFAYPFLLNVPGYDVRAVPLPDSERDLNLEMLRFISDETAGRGLHFQLGLWTHAYQWTRSPRANYTISGLTPDTHAPYCRDALKALLAACPNINGITFRIHGESGVAEGNYDLWKTIFDGAVQCGRRVEIDMHAKGMDQGMIDVALATGLPVNISPKFWAEHMGLPYMQGAIRPQEMPPRDARDGGFFSRSSGSRSFLRYGYGDLFAEDRRYGVLHRIWPGTQRVLLWGDPAMAAAYGRVSSFCGSKGVELFEPLFFKGRKGSGLPGGRDGYADISLRPAGGDFEKYEYTYRVWGRSLYRPADAAEGGLRWLRNQFASGAENAQAALASASRILPLVTTAHCPSAANNNYWPEMYFNMAIVDAGRPHPYSDTPSPRRFGTVGPLDPEFFLGIDEFADELLKGERSGKYSPVWVAARLQRAAVEAETALHRTHVGRRRSQRAEFRRFAADITIQAGLGRFYAAKFRAALLHAIYLRQPHPETIRRAIELYRTARDAWAKLADTAKSIYRDDLTFGPEYFQRGSWRDRLSAIDADLADLEKLRAQTDPKTPGPLSGREKDGVDLALSAGDEPETLPVMHRPVGSFRRGEPLSISLRVLEPRAFADLTGVHLPRNSPAIDRVRLRYRRVNQAETWRTLELEHANDLFGGTIPADYTDSPFPLQYHFQLRTDRGRVQLYPGLEPGWNGQPYFVVRQA